MQHPKMMVALIVVGAFLFLALSSLFVVGQTEQALVLQFGKPVAVHKMPGLKLKMPFIQNVVFYDKRLIDFYATRPGEVITTDKKRLIVDSFVRYRITDPLKFYQAVRDEDNMQTRLNSILESSLGQVIGNVPMSALLSAQRVKIMHQIRTLMNEQARGALPVAGAKPTGLEAGGYGIEIVDVRIKRTDLPQQNSEAIFKRMQTERIKEAKQIRATGEEEAQKIRARADKERTIILADAQQISETTRGQGDATAAKISADAFGLDPEFYGFYRKLQAYRKSFSNKDTRMILSPDSDFLKGMDK